MPATLTLEALTRPTYTAAEAARWARTTPTTARRWVTGYVYRSPNGERRWSSPVTQKSPDQPFLSFEDLVEIAAVAAARTSGLSLAKIRQAVDFARTEMNLPRPLLSERFLTDGRALYLHDARSDPALVNLNRFGQLAWQPVEDVLRDLDYRDELATRWWPTGRLSQVLVDPAINFGRPILEPIGVRTESLVDRFDAGDSIEELAEEYEVESGVIQNALRFENRFGAIAA